jgi:hypothetical protein
MVPEVYQVFWAAMARGEFITDAASEAGTYRKQGTRWLFAAGGVRPAGKVTGDLTFAEGPGPELTVAAVIAAAPAAG